MLRQQYARERHTPWRVLPVRLSVVVIVMGVVMVAVMWLGEGGCRKRDDENEQQKLLHAPIVAMDGREIGGKSRMGTRGVTHHLPQLPLSLKSRLSHQTLRTP